MADNDLQAELDNLFGNNEEKSPSEGKAAPEAPAAPAETAPAAPAPASKPKPLMGGKAGARPLGGGKGFPKTSTISAATAASGAAPTAAAAPAAPVVPAATATNINIPAGVPGVMRPASQCGAPSKVPLILSGLSLLFTLVCIIMVNNVGSRVNALQDAIEAQSRAQLEILNKQTKALNEQTTSLKKFEKVLEDQLLRKDSDFQKRMRIVTEAIDEVKAFLPKK